MNLFVANLDWNVDSEELEKLFEEHGEVISARVIRDRESGRSRGFGFVEMSDDESGSKAIELLNGASFKNRDLVVKTANN